MRQRLKFTKSQIAIEIIIILVLVGMYAYLFLNWNSLPDKIPGHYNAAGEVNRWGSKSELIALPIITTVLYLLLSVILLFPSSWSLPGKVTECNSSIIYNNVRYLLLFMKLEVTGMFAYILYNSMEARNLPGSYLPVVLIMILGTMIFFFYRIIRVSHTK